MNVQGVQTLLCDWAPLMESGGRVPVYTEPGRKGGFFGFLSQICFVFLTPFLAQAQNMQGDLLAWSILLQAAWGNYSGLDLPEAAVPAPWNPLVSFPDCH